MKIFQYHVHLIEHECGRYSYRVVSDSAPTPIWYSSPAPLIQAMKQANDYIDSMRKDFYGSNPDTHSPFADKTDNFYSDDARDEWVQISRPLWNKLKEFIKNYER